MANFPDHLSKFASATNFAVAYRLPAIALMTLSKTATVAAASPVFNGRVPFIKSAQSSRILSFLTIFGNSSTLMKVVLGALLKYGRSTLLQYPLESLVNLYRNYWKQDSSARLLQNTQDLQTYQEKTALIQNNYAEVLQVLSLLHTHFNPALQETDQRLTTMMTESATREIDLQAFESSLAIFIQEFTHMQSNDNLLIYANALPNLQKAEERLKTAKDHLETAKQDMADTLQELALLQQETLQQEETLDRLIDLATQRSFK